MPHDTPFSMQVMNIFLLSCTGIILVTHLMLNFVMAVVAD
jgi:hypothetical protein